MKKFVKFLSVIVMLFASLFVTQSWAYDDVEELLGVYDEEGRVIDENMELGAISRVVAGMKNPQLTKSVANLRKVAQAKTNVINKVKQERGGLLSDNLTKGQKFLYAKKDKLSASMRKMFEDKTVNFADGVIFHNAWSAGSISGIFEMVKSNNSGNIFSRGYSSLLEHGKVPEGLCMAVDYITLERGTFVTVTENIFSTTPQAMWNLGEWGADFVIYQDSEEIFRKPLFSFNEARVGEDGITQDGSGAPSAGVNIRKRILIKAEAKLKFNIEYPDGVSVYAGAGLSTYYRVALFGDMTTIKQNN